MRTKDTVPLLYPLRGNIRSGWFRMVDYTSWNPSFSVSSMAIDAQHRQVVDIINELYKFMQEASTKGQLKLQLYRLRIFTEAHFRYEETLLRLIRYPEFDQHKQYHDEMKARTKEIINKIIEGKESGKSLLDFLRKWWINHIKNIDKSYVLDIKELKL